MPDCQEQHSLTSQNRIYFRSFRQRLRFTPPPPSGYSHFAVFAAHSFTSFRNCSAGATIPKPQSYAVRVSAHVKYTGFAWQNLAIFFLCILFLSDKIIFYETNNENFKTFCRVCGYGACACRQCVCAKRLF